MHYMSSSNVAEQQDQCILLPDMRFATLQGVNEWECLGTMLDRKGLYAEQYRTPTVQGQQVDGSLPQHVGEQSDQGFDG